MPLGRKLFKVRVTYIVMGHLANKLKTVLIFVLLMLLLVAYLHPETAQKITAAVTAAFGSG